MSNSHSRQTGGGISLDKLQTAASCSCCKLVSTVSTVSLVSSPDWEPTDSGTVHVNNASTGALDQGDRKSVV